MIFLVLFFLYNNFLLHISFQQTSKRIAFSNFISTFVASFPFLKENVRERKENGSLKQGFFSSRFLFP